MKERPIIYNAEMVRATLEDRKTKTRRVIKACSKATLHDGSQPEWVFTLAKCPYGQVGDRLWVREAWATNKDYDDSKPSDLPIIVPLYYKGDWVDCLECDSNNPENGIPLDIGKWRPSIFMPRWASRITLEITGIRVERLQDITEEDANKEGNPYPDMGGKGSFPPLWWFRELWDSLNAKRGYSWESNPWVWVISFKKV